MRKMRDKLLFWLGIAILMIASSFIHDQTKEVVSVIDTKQYIALTYDDGPSLVSTEKLLALLDQYGARATFFVNGNRADANQLLVREIAEQGHEIGNHTLDHVWLTKTDDEELKRQIYGNENLLRHLTGHEGTMLLRPPYGDINASVLEKIDVPFIMWSVDSRDWEIQDVAQIHSNVMKNLEDGDIIIMHDGYETTIEATENLLKELDEMNFEVVTVSELFALKNKEIPLHEKVNKCK